MCGKVMVCVVGGGDGGDGGDGDHAEILTLVILVDLVVVKVKAHPVGHDAGAKFCQVALVAHDLDVIDVNVGAEQLLEDTSEGAVTGGRWVNAWANREAVRTDAQ